MANTVTPLISSRPKEDVAADIDQYEVRVQMVLRSFLARARRQGWARASNCVAAGLLDVSIDTDCVPYTHFALVGLLAHGVIRCHACCFQRYHTTHGGELETRKKQYQDMVNKYYDLATSFYEYGKDCFSVPVWAERWELLVPARAPLARSCKASIHSEIAWRMRSFVRRNRSSVHTGLPQ
jgi:hypothetical protein